MLPKTSALDLLYLGNCHIFTYMISQSSAADLMYMWEKIWTIFYNWVKESVSFIFLESAPISSVLFFTIYTYSDIKFSKHFNTHLTLSHFQQNWQQLTKDTWSQNMENFSKWKCIYWTRGPWWPYIAPLILIVFKVLYSIHISKTSNPPWWPCFSTDRIYLNNLCRRSPKEHLCQIFFISGRCFWTRRYYNYTY